MSVSEEAACPTCQANQLDRADWGEGPWQDEPDKSKVLRHAGLHVMAHRGGTGAWCGYVGVTPDHPLYGIPYQEAEDLVAVHGGLTYAEPCQGCVCHPGAEELWWFGFDCAHAFDLSPGLEARLRKARAGYIGEDWPEKPLEMREKYWTLAECLEEAMLLAEQLVALGKKTLWQRLVALFRKIFR